MEVQGVGQQLQPGQGGHPERGGERFGGERRHQRGPLPSEGCLLVRAQAREAGVGPGDKPRLLGGGVQHTPLRRQAEAAAFGLPALGCRFSGQREQPLRVEVSDLDRSTHRVGFDHVYSQPDAADNPTPNRAENGGWGGVFSGRLGFLWVPAALVRGRIALW